MKRTFALLIAIIISLLFSGQALAHALLLRSLPESNAVLPQPPASIELWFSEPLENGFSLVQLIGSDGDPIPLGTQTVDANDPTHLSAPVNALPPGIYTVSWTTLSQTDGHAFSGNFPFTVLNPDGSYPAGTAAIIDSKERSELPTPLQTAARWLMLTGGILLMGLALFLGYVAAELMRNDPELNTRLNTLGIKLLALAVVSIVLGSWLQLITQAIQLESLAQLPRLVSSTYGGALNLARQAFSVAGLLNILWLSPQPLPNWQQRILRVVALYAVALVALLMLTAFQGQGLIAVPVSLLLAGMAFLGRRSTLLISGSAMLLCFSMGSHAGAVTGSFWAIIFDFIHLLGTAAWAGGLMLLPLMLHQHRQTAAAENPTSLGPLFRRYGQMAKLSFFVLWTTGLLSSLVQIPSIESLFNTHYGRVLLIKIALMLVVWGISMVSSRVFRGRPDPAKMPALMQKFTRLVGGAAVASLVLMLVVAVLVQTQPPPKENPQESVPDYRSEIITADDLDIQLQVSPAKIGLNQFYVQLAHPDGSSIGDVQLVRLMFDQQDSQLGQSNVEMQLLGPDRYWIEGTFLNRPGKWNISIYVRRRSLDDLIADVGAITLTAPSTQREMLFYNPFTTVPLGLLWAGVLMVVGLEMLRWQKNFKPLRPMYLRVFRAIAFALILLGVLLALSLFFYYR